jgi:NitT/TauT family transport system substrate-binding protein
MITRRNFTAGLLASPILCSAAGSAQELQKIVIAQPSAGFIYLPVYVARGLGLFKDEGLDVEAVIFDKGASAALTAVLSRNAEVYVGLPAIPIQARARGQRTKVFGGILNQCGSDIVISAEAAARAKFTPEMSVQDKAAALRGLTIAVAGAGSITDLLVRHVAKFGGLNPERDVTIIPIGGGSNMLAAFSQKKIDGYCLSAPTSTIGIANMGGVSMFDFVHGEYEPLRDFLYVALSARDDWLVSNEATARKLLRAMWRALIAMRSRPDESKAAIRIFFATTDEAVLEQAWQGILPGFGQTLAIDVKGINRNLEFMRDARGGEIDVSLPETFTNSFVEQVRSTI